MLIRQSVCIQILSAIVWLARVVKVKSEETKKVRKTVELFSLAD